MKRRSFIHSATLGLVGASMVAPHTAFDIAPQPWSCTRRQQGKSIKVLLDEVVKPFKIMQVSDSHISCDSDADQSYEKYSARMAHAFAKQRHCKTGEMVSPIEAFAALMDLAVEERVDLIALTGDIVNYPSATAVEKVTALVKKTNIPHLYTAGNHDWHYEGMSGSMEDLRKHWIAERLMPLYSSNQTRCSSTVCNGINIVTLDNSIYQIGADQLQFYKQQIEKGLPMLLMVHIPLYMPSMNIITTGNPTWGWDTDQNYALERRVRWPKSGNTSVTNDFLKIVYNTPKLVGIFAGHHHEDYTVNTGNNIQFVAGPAFNGEYRMIELAPKY
ncbi:hypothetical protein GCM10023231_29600 [Olivibacter ginsenosidimutans]|uniref:Calcineurin-like phosphoesterase domain-containing protein n=1 Tax=Olivibacter ginsenosidimutans TaxID=1176537 RepID=A0ABP9BTZ5_9SPHI